MKNDRDPLTEKSRSHLRSKRRKTNIILNSLIAVVLLLIIIVSINIFGSDDKSNVEEVASSTENTEENHDTSETDSVNREDDGAEEDRNLTQEDTDENKEKDKEKDKAEEDVQDELIIKEGSADPNVKQSIVNPSWEPVGTTQSGGPAQDYNMSGVDWQEMIAAVSSATGFDESKGDILYRLENNGPQKSAATILKKDTNQKFRVYIEWVDGQGWKPVLVEEIYN